jgi:hypothetical protein
MLGDAGRAGNALVGVSLGAVLALTAGGALPASAAPGDDDPEAQLERVRKRSLTQGKVCPDPAKPCGEFKPHDLLE